VWTGLNKDAVLSLHYEERLLVLNLESLEVRACFHYGCALRGERYSQRQLAL